MRSSDVIFRIVLTLLIFSLWAGFALLIVNPYLSEKLPGYTVGSLCIWEFVAIIIASLIAYIMNKKWGGIQILKEKDGLKAKLNFNYLIFFLTYFILAVLLAVWQFLKFINSI